MNTQIYAKNCPKCKEETPHRVMLISRSKGIKLRCLKCMAETKYTAITQLKAWNFEE